jgi:hypothetical protein
MDPGYKKLGSGTLPLTYLAGFSSSESELRKDWRAAAALFFFLADGCFLAAGAGRGVEAAAGGTTASRLHRRWVIRYRIGFIL